MLKHILLSVALCVSLAASALAADDPLPAWNDGAAKAALISFVTAAVTEGGPDYIAPDDRIATFDNDGTLWSEQPVYFQGFFVIDRIKAMAPDHPEWKTTQPFQGILEGDMHAAASMGEKGLVELVTATHAGMTQDQFNGYVAEWLATAKHPRFDKPFTDLVFEPMLQALDYLRANGFQTWIVSGGGADFMRVFAEPTYGIPPQQVVGSQIGVKYEVIDGVPQFTRTPEVVFVDDNVGKPVGILRDIGRRPVIAFGNSDGDYQMLQYTTTGDGPRLGLIVHHTDAVREWAYDRDSKIGRLDKALDDAPEMGWVVIDMARDWASVYPFKE